MESCDLDDEERSFFFLYHSFGQSAGYGYIPKNEMIELVRKNGLLSHSTIGRRKDLEDGTIVAITRDRIWFSRRMGCEFTRYSDPLVLRVKFDEEEFEDEFYTVYDDDQYWSKDRCEVFIEKSRPFAIPPWDIDYWDGNDWVPVSPRINGWKPPQRNDMERMQPSIREDFKRLGLRPWNDSEVKAYVYLQPDDKMTKEEFWKLADDQSEEINRFVVFDYEVC